MKHTKEHRNRLAQETSPYLLQHASNPVDWYPWSEEAFALARESGKPILLSIGYSACHWCHVMAHESFEDEKTAELMNRLFVNIKVDREERPDIDRIYQMAHQLLTQRPGGWPLTMFIDPDGQRPFFGGTYFPDEARYGMPSFRDLVTRVAAYYAEHRKDVRDQGEQLRNIFEQITRAAPADEGALSHAALDAARKQLGQTFDRQSGGFGGAPKFPHTSGLERLLRHWRAGAHGEDPDVQALYMTTLSLTRMAEGGIYDHLGGGFCRYTVDGEWQIPHFEKMLYDNGPLIALYAQAHLATGEPLFAKVASESSEWLLTDMRSPEGAFYSSRDADSEGEEGRYYVWTREEVQALLPNEDYEVVARRFGIDGEPNFEGKWHLTVRESQEALARALERPQSDIADALERSRAIMLEERSRRVAPARDEKQLASWNALAIRGLAIAGNILDRSDFVAAAVRAADFIEERMFRDGRLFASYKDEAARFPAYLDDHAFLLDAMLELLQADWQPRHLALAQRLADILLAHFHDAESGGFWFTADDHEALMYRPKPLADESMPSGNGIASLALQRLGFLLGETRYLRAAESTLRHAARVMTEHSQAHVTLLTALEEYLENPETIIIRGAAPEIRKWREAAQKIYAPRRLIFAIPSDCEDLPGALAQRAARAGGTVAYRCLGSHCSMPLESLDALAAELSESRP
ncbi:MAG TPA: thioredoxin domain-containing protein [Woeseiaceae bacterium]|nr:thioredoxin domain-containing protein [Woeseiaceae bacterium]